MKNRFTPPARYALLTACLLSGFAQAQSVNFTDDTNPTGNMGASYSAQEVKVGIRSTGGLTIQNGGQLLSEEATIGDEAGSTGTVLVDGPNSTWDFASANLKGLTIGNYGRGTLQVRNGASVSLMWTVSTAYRPGSSALVEVDGVNSTLSGNVCHFDGPAPSTIRISNGGVIHCRELAHLEFGELTLSGVGSKWISTVLSLGNGPRSSSSIVTVQEGAAIEGGRNVLLIAPTAGLSGSRVLNIEGTTTPGAVISPTIRFDGDRANVLNLNHTDASGNYQLAPSLDGNGQVNVNNSGSTTLTGDNASYTGITRIYAGTLRAGAANSLSPASDFVVAADGTLNTNTFSSTVLSLDNSGLVTMAAGGTSNVLTVAQNYTSNGGVVAMNTALGADSSPTQKLVVQGDTSGDTILNISNLGGTGAATTGNGIMVVQVGGASNGTFSLPAPGYVEAGGYRYALAKVGNHWFLQSDAHVEASGPEASVVCTPAELSDTANQVATCTVTLTAAPTADLPINLVLPAANPRYTTTCASPLVVPANATQASCTITATPNTTAGDGDVTAELAIAPPTTADAYTPAGPAAQVLIKDAGDTTTQPPATLKQVPTLGSFGLAALAALMGAVGLRRSRKTV